MTAHRSLIPLALLFAHCGGAPAPFTELARAQKTAYRAAANAGRVAFLDGATASTDPDRAGVDVRVITREGGSVLAAPSAGAVRALALLPDAVATLEQTWTLADQRIVIRPFEGAPVTAAHEGVPMALAASAGGLLWIEAAVRGIEDTDGDRVVDTTVVGLTLVEADARGAVASRTAVAVPGGVRISASILAPFPDAFGLVASGDAVHFGWGSLTPGRGSVVYRIARSSGTAAEAWRGSVATVGESVTELGLQLALLGDDLVVTGALLRRAAVTPHAGFVWHRGVISRTAEAVRHAASDGEALLFAQGRGITRFGDAPAQTDVIAPDLVTGLAIDGDRIVVTVADGVQAHAR